MSKRPPGGKIDPENKQPRKSAAGKATAASTPRTSDPQAKYLVGRENHPSSAPVRHPPRNTKSKDADILKVKEHFNIDSAGTATWIKKKPDILACLITLGTKLPEYFEIIDLNLQLEHDELTCHIWTSELGIQVAEAMHRFKKDWWLDASFDVGDRIRLSLGFE